MEGEPWIRPAAVAGRFYPGDAGVLERQVSAMLDAGRASGPTVAAAIAAVAPHAGYIYSGGVAGRVFARV